MRNIAIIPARGGSKRIPRKNIKPFLGKPIIAYSIENAIATGLFEEIMVSTDDEEIASVARQYGAKVPFMRSDATANDYATLNDVLHEVLLQYKLNGIIFDNMCCILATSPLLCHCDIINGYNKLIDSSFSIIVPIVRFSYPILRSFYMDKTGEIKYKWPEYAKSRSQDLPDAYHDSGTFYWYKIEKWMNMEIKRGAVIMNERYVQDIDTEDDWRLAELKYNLMNNVSK